MPNGHEEDRNRVYRKSRFWGVIWDIGDAAYYVGLISSVLAPTMLILSTFSNLLQTNVLFKSWDVLAYRAGLGVVLLLTCFPAGVLVCSTLKCLAERCAGVDRASDS
jgi:hypothetical protein